MGKLRKRICSSIFFFFLGHLLAGKEFKSIFADPVEHWYGRTLKTSVFPLGATFSALSCKEKGVRLGRKRSVCRGQCEL